MRVTLLLITILFMSSNSLLAQVKTFTVPYSDSIVIDGSNADWKNIKPVTKNYGIDIKAPSINIKTLAIATDKENLIFYLSMQNQASARPTSSFFKIAIDTDNDKKTGADSSVKMNIKVPIPGFDRAIAVYKGNTSKGFYRVLDPADKYKKLKEEEDPKKVAMNSPSGIMEFSIPLKEILKEGNEKIKILFAEVGTTANAATKESYMGLILDLSVINQENAATVDQQAEKAASPKLNISSAWILLIGLSFSTLFLALAVCKKAGVGTGSAYICIIPFAGPFFFLWSLAFGKWSVHNQIAALEQQSTSEEAEEE
jgi:hypothetical protein